MLTTSKVKQILSRIPTWAKIKISGRGNLIPFLEIVLEVQIHPTAAQTLTGKFFFLNSNPCSLAKESRSDGEREYSLASNLHFFELTKTSAPSFLQFKSTVPSI